VGRVAIVLAFGVAAGLIAEGAVVRAADAVVVAVDLAVGWLLIGSGLFAWQRRPASLIGPLVAATGFAWFLANVLPPAVLLHRGVLAHVFVTYPSGDVHGRLAALAVVGAYLLMLVLPLAGPTMASAASGTLFLTIGVARLAARGPNRRSRIAPGLAAISLGCLLLVGAGARLVDTPIDLAAAYAVAVAAIGVALVADLVWGGWDASLITRFIVDLGDAASAGTVRDRLARAVGDPSLEIAYPTGDGRFVDEGGAVLAVPAPGAGRVVTPLTVSDREAAIVVHDPAVLDDPELVRLVAASTELARSNTTLQAAILGRAREVDRSRARLVAATDAERALIEAAIRAGPVARLERARAQLVTALARSGDDRSLTELVDEVGAANTQLLDFARGVDPLAGSGLEQALQDLIARSPIAASAELDLETIVDDVIDTTTYYVCSEALANAAKHSRAAHVRVVVRTAHDVRTVSVTDDGVGDAQPRPGGGLDGLIDRVEALGGRLAIERPSTGGTRIVAAIPRRNRSVDPAGMRVA
jgi:signal transduction histidine kinase